MADLYKEHLCIDLAFYLTRDMAGQYDKHKVSTYFRERVVESDLLDRLSKDVPDLFEGL
jgi:CRISPR-associated protein Cas1